MHILNCPALPGEKTLTDVACQQSLFALSTRQAYNASSELQLNQNQLGETGTSKRVRGEPGGEFTDRAELD